MAKTIRTDSEILDWLQEQEVDTIYMDDGRIIDVSILSVREAICLRMDVGWPGGKW